MNTHEKKMISSDELLFDSGNPRLVGEDVSELKDDAQVIRALSQGADIAELVISILENTFVDFEPIIVIQENGGYRVLEGNRRLAAIKLLKDESLSSRLENDLKYHIDRPIPQNVLDSIQEIPAIIVANEDDAQAYIGFKHVNGPHKWTSFAKAKFVTEWHKSGLSIDGIAKKVGDKNQTVKNLIAGMLVLEQAEQEEVFEIKDRTKRGVFGFSHLYTALNRKEYRDYLGLDKEWVDSLTKNPIQRDHIEKLETVLKYMYGSKKDDINSVIRSQNPNLKQLGMVLSKPVAERVLRETNNLELALEETEEKSSLFEKSLISAHTHLQKAFANVSSFNGNSEVSNLAEEMEVKVKLLVQNMRVMTDDK